MQITWKKGIEDKQIGQLIQYSLTDENVGKFTSDKERFRDRNTFEEWKKRGREIFTLADEENNLLGIIWLGPKELPERNYKENIDKDKYKMSFAIRIYGEARGKGMALDFMKKCIKNSGIWLEVSGDNLAARAVYTKFGFKQVSLPDTNNKIIMIY